MSVRRRTPLTGSLIVAFIVAIAILSPTFTRAQSAPAATDTLASALSAQAWEQVEQGIDRALAWLATQQRGDGSFNAPASAQPATTAFTVMAYLSRGHLPGEGPYGDRIERAIDYVIAAQSPNGLLARAQSNGKTANYNHAIAGLMLTEVYGMTDPARAAKLKPAITKALDFSRRDQLVPRSRDNEGGWRYLYSTTYGDSDLSVTAWQLMFLRSAKNAEFDVPKQWVDDAIDYVWGCWSDNEGIFYYKRTGGDRRWSRGMMGAGILSLAMAGEHGTDAAQRAGDWLVTHPFRRFGEGYGGGDRFFYSTYYCSQGMAQLGGDRWRRFYPALAGVLLNSQRPSGEWPTEPYGSDRQFGNTYTTAMAVLSLTPPLQLLPVYQR